MIASAVNLAAVARGVGYDLVCVRCKARYLIILDGRRQFASMACPACEQEIKGMATPAPAWADTAKRTVLGAALVAAALLSWAVSL